jgi:GntR family transcriptional repressor for pyruvate dehydrogenase complex
VKVSTSAAEPDGGGAAVAGQAPSDRHLDAFRPIKLQKAADAVVAVIADAIRGGLFEPGDLLPSERDLAMRLRVSRNVVREAIDLLRRAGIVSVKRGAGGGIRVEAVERLHEVVAGLRGKTHDVMQAALEARRAIELPAFLLTAERATESDMDALGALVEELAELGDASDGFYAVDQKFHREVVRLSGNPLLAEFYRATLMQLAEIREQFPVLRVPYADAVRNQRVLYAALRTRRPAKIEAMLDAHLAATEVIYLGRPLRPTQAEPSAGRGPDGR